MERLSESDDDGELEHGERVEEQVKSVDYDVWRCACGETLTLPYRRTFTSYGKCGRCGRRTVKTARRTIEAASYTSSGRAEDTHSCEACGEVRVEHVVLPKLTPPSSGSSSGSSSGGRSHGGGGSRGGGFGGSGSTGGGGGGGRY
jgi:uncharacterized protein